MAHIRQSRPYYGLDFQVKQPKALVAGVQEPVGPAGVLRNANGAGEGGRAHARPPIIKYSCRGQLTPPINKYSCRG